ncbi:MAG: hypothetical protein DCC67_13175 [Planctomycetota bacterium]|nr:MAG: hypothetical protein DCC67_13175 [Planctomycetota bacterium]
MDKQRNLFDESAPASPDEKLLVPADTVATMLSISVRSLWRLLSAGRLVPPVRLGRSVRWHVAEVRRWIDAGCPPPDE